MYIIGTGRSLPRKVVTNNMLAERLDTSDEWISTRTGIHSRRLITTERLEDLAIDAARQALEASGLRPDELDFLICSNVANNLVTPALSCIVQGAIGASCPCIDLNGACAGFVYGADYAEAYMQTGRAENVLIVAAEEPTRFCNWRKRETSVLFGDGAGAVVATKGDGHGMLASKLFTVSKKDAITYSRRLEPTPYEQEDVDINEPLIMNGREVFRLAVSSAERDIRYVLDKAGIQPSDVRYYLLHQANQRIIDSIADHLGLDSNYFPTNINRYGNTSSASIPILMDEMRRDGRFRKGDKVVLCAFGAGFVAGTILLQM